MTREEAITKLHWLKAELIKGTDLNEPLDMAIEALSADTVSRETYHNLVTASNDIDRALREYQDKEENGELVSVVRCKDCRYYNPIDENKPYPCGYGIYMCNKDDFCSYGERREP